MDAIRLADLVEFLDRIKPPSPKMRRLKTAPESSRRRRLGPGAPAWELPGFDADGFSDAP